MSLGSDEPQVFLFLHVMKTGGTSLLSHAWKHFGRYGVEPPLLRGDPPPPGTISAYESVARVRDLPPERRAVVRFYAGHYPFLVRDIVAPDVTLTVLREPLDRTVSILRQLQQGHRRMGGRPLEEIYDDKRLRSSMIRNFQVKQFAMTHADLEEQAAWIAAIRGVDEPTLPDSPQLLNLAMDEQRLELAKANLAQVEEVGLLEDYGGFLGRLRSAYGWELDEDVRLRPGAHDLEVPESLLARIAEDLHWETEFYRYAVELCASRAARP